MGMGGEVVGQCCHKLKQISGLVKTSPFKPWRDLETRVVNLKPIASYEQFRIY